MCHGVESLWWKRLEREAEETRPTAKPEAIVKTPEPVKTAPGAGDKVKKKEYEPAA